ncbi:MAG: ABC transporter substrate-binding protein [Syntrophorhabdales bacterium]|jgi:ABC-type branched-subunit amino acid transport system substrate-binding protein
MSKLREKLVIAVLVLVVFPMFMVRQAEAEKVLKIGSIVPLSQKTGIEMQRWLKLFAKIYNEQGGWLIGGERYRVEYTAYDGGVGDAAKARIATERAILQDGVKFLVCNWGDVDTQTITITEPNKVLALGAGLNDATMEPSINYYIRANSVFFGRGLTYVIQKDYMKRGCKTDTIVDPDTENGRYGTKLYRTSAKMAGLKVLPDIFFDAHTVDFSPIATKIKQSNSDMIELPFVTGDQVTNLLAALKDAGWKGPLYAGNMDPVVLQNLVIRVGKEFLENLETVFFDPRGIQKDPGMLALMDRYTKEYGEFRTEGCMWIGAWFIFRDAVENTQSTDVEVLRKYLQNSKHGVRTLDGYSQLFARPDKEKYRTVDVAPGHGVGIIKDGKLTALKTVSVKDQYLATIRCMDMVDVYQKYWDKYGKPVFPNEPSVLDYEDLKR